MTALLAYIQITNFIALVAIVSKKKNEILIMDVFSFDIQNYINENGLIIYPLSFAEDIVQSIKEKYPVDEVVLLMSVKDAVFSLEKEEYISNQKEISENAKNALEQKFPRPAEAFEMSWIHTGDILDDGPSAYSVLMYSCYPNREIKKMCTVFDKYGMHVKTVYTPELSMIALYEQYINDYTDPNTVIIESGFSANPNGYSCLYEYKRNVFSGFKQNKQGFFFIVTALEGLFNGELSFKQIFDLLMSCGISKTTAPEDANDVLEMHGISADTWYAGTEKVFHNFCVVLNNDVLKQSTKFDNVILSGPLGDIPGIEEYLTEKYSIPVKIWKIQHEVQIANTTFLYTKGDNVPSIYSGLIAAIYFEQYLKKVKNGTFSKKTIEINVDRSRRVLYGILGASAALVLILSTPSLIKIGLINNNINAHQTEINEAKSLQQDIDKISANLAIQESFLEKSRTSSFDLKDFLYSCTLLKPSEVTILSIDTSNFIDEEDESNTQAYYHIKKAVEAKRAEESGEGLYDPYAIDISGKDWTFGLPWTDVELTEAGIETYLKENSIENVNKYLVSKVVIRGYGSVSSIARYSKDLEATANISRVDVVGVESKTIYDGSGSAVDTNVFEFNVWFGEGI